MSRPTWDQRALPGGEREISLRPVGGRTERVVYAALIAAMIVGGGVLAPALFGFMLLGVGALMAAAFVRITRHRERWVLKPGSAVRLGSKGGTFVPVRVLAVAERDVDERHVLRLMLEHSSGKVQIGVDTFDDDERARGLAKAMAEGLGVPVVLP